MIQRYVLDENIVILAQNLRNDTGADDSTCRRLLDAIIDICHTIVLDGVLWDKYYNQLRSLPPDQPHGPRSVMRIMYLATSSDGKIENIGRSARGFPEENDIPQGSQDDVPIVRLAVETGAILVTNDQALRDDLNSSGVQEQYNLQVFSPEQALAVL